MKALLFATTAIVALAGQAMAADMPVKARPVVAVPGCAQFGGFYVGAHAGFGYYDHTWRDRDAWSREPHQDLLRPNRQINESGFIGGIQGGWNWQQGCTVFGLQADYSFASINAHAFETVGDIANVDTLTVDSKLKGLGTVRLRTGIVVDNLLLYATGGIGFGSFDRSYTVNEPRDGDIETFTTDKTKWAWVAGIGTEWAVWNGWSIQSEVLYARFENDEATHICSEAICLDDKENPISRPTRFEHQDSAWITKIGVSYRWGGAPAATAALAGQALATDMPVKAPSVVAAPSCAQFGGLHVGAHAGFGYYDHTWRDRDAWTAEAEQDLRRPSLQLNESGFIGGVQGGWNWQQGCTVFGLQADYSFAGINANVFETDGSTTDLDTLTVDSKLKGLGTLRLRSGIVVDNLLLYATGGTGFGSFDRSYARRQADGDTETFSADKTKWAWVAGAGAEWAAWNGWSIQSEVLYARFEDDEATFICSEAICESGPRPTRFEHQDSAWITKIGVNYRWGGAPAEIAALAGQAPAADMPVKAPPAMAASSCAQFGGFFAGGHAGFGYYDHTWGDLDAWSDEVTTDLSRTNLPINESGFIGGVQGGWNWQQGCTVFGLQADYSFASINAHAFETSGDPVERLETLTVDSKLKGLGTMRLRSGIVVDSLLLYATGGIGFGSFDRSYTANDPDDDRFKTFATDKTKWAWVAGLGTEWAAWNGWSIQSEVLYARFENDEATFICSEYCFDPRPARFEHQDSAWISKIGVNYRWGGGPAAIRY